MKIGLSLAMGITSSGKVRPWILYDGLWNDDGVWIDEAVWVD